MIIIGEVMKRIYSLLLIVLTLFGLSSCFLFGKNTTYPDMVEYGRQEVLDVAKEVKALSILSPLIKLELN